jgi:hypothetical protein
LNIYLGVPQKTARPALRLHPPPLTVNDSSPFFKSVRKAEQQDGLICAKRQLAA